MMNLNLNQNIIYLSNRYLIVLALVLLQFVFSTQLSLAQTGTASLSQLNPGDTVTIRKNYGKRFPVAKENFPTSLGGADVIVNGASVGPGVITHGPGPVATWPVPIATAVSMVPSQRDTSITKNLLQTSGAPLSDTQYQLIARENNQRLIEELYDPEKYMWVAPAMGNVGLAALTNSANSMAYNQTANAISYTGTYLTNFTVDSSNRWNKIRNQLFMPMAILLLLPGAVLSQVKAIVASGMPVLGEVNPLDGILRTIIAVFMIPATYLVLNYGIDISNSLAYTVFTGYGTIFGTSMYQDAIDAEKMANPQGPTTNAMANVTPPSSSNGTTQTQPTSNSNFNSMGFIYGLSNLSFSSAWNILCAFQVAYLRFLWCVGPIVAAFWAWPMQSLRGALPSWISGVITVCFWNFFWNTLVLVVAVSKYNPQVDMSFMVAANFIANVLPFFAFKFADTVSSAVNILGQNVLSSLPVMTAGHISSKAPKK